MAKAKTKLLLGIYILCLCMFPVMITNAEEPYFASADDDNEFVFNGDDKTLSYRVAGKNREKGIFNLYLKNDPKDLSDIPSAADLNAVEPAAGIQFNLDF